jgi:hypothetical protein
MDTEECACLRMRKALWTMLTRIETPRQRYNILYKTVSSVTVLFASTLDVGPAYADAYTRHMQTYMISAGNPTPHNGALAALSLLPRNRKKSTLRHPWLWRPLR